MFLGNDGTTNYTISDSDFEAMVDLLRRGWIAVDAAAMRPTVSRVGVGEFVVSAHGGPRGYALSLWGTHWDNAVFFSEAVGFREGTILRADVATVKESHTVGGRYSCPEREFVHWFLHYPPAPTVAVNKLLAALYAETRPALLERLVVLAPPLGTATIRMCPRVVRSAGRVRVAHLLPDEYACEVAS